MDSSYSDGARLFKAFCDENRLKIIELLRGGEKCACVILEELEIAQSTLSHHLKILCESGIVWSRQEGKWTHYSLSPEGCLAARQLLAKLTAAAEPRVSKRSCAC